MFINHDIKKKKRHYCGFFTQNCETKQSANMTDIWNPETFIVTFSYYRGEARELSTIRPPAFIVVVKASSPMDYNVESTT